MNSCQIEFSFYLQKYNFLFFIDNRYKNLMDFIFNRLHIEFHLRSIFLYTDQFLEFASPDKGAEKEETDKLKSVLAEVLQDLRKQKKCYVRYEFKQGCFHITVR